MNKKIINMTLACLSSILVLTGCSFGNKTSQVQDSGGSVLKPGDNISEELAFDSIGYVTDELISTEYNSTTFDVATVLSSEKSSSNMRGWFTPSFKMNYAVDISKVEFDIYTTTTYTLFCGSIAVAVGYEQNDSAIWRGTVRKVVCQANQMSHITLNFDEPVRAGKGKYLRIMSSIYDENGDKFYNSKDPKKGHNWYNLKVEMKLA